MAVRIPVNLTLPEDLVADLDAMAGPRNRSAFVEDAVRYRLRREQMRRAWEDARGVLKGRPEFSSSEAVVDWVRARRSERTDAAGG